MSKGEPGVLEELVENVHPNTRTIELLNKFEGHDDSSTKYSRLVVQNGWCVRIIEDDYYAFNFVIEREALFYNKYYYDEITFTEFKKGNIGLLGYYLKSEVSDDIVKKYADKDKYIKFSKTFVLKAQTRLERFAVGGGIPYGDTRNYYIVGAYVTGYNVWLQGFPYYPEVRKPYE